ncbi:MAG: hypothetical protein V3T77_00660, partial [Planctomycetota bacterium]
TNQCGDAVSDVAMVDVMLCDIPFQRGECNDDGRGMDISDAIFIIFYMFADGDRPPCLAACDVNGDGILDLADAIFVLNYLLFDGPQPFEPFVACGLPPEPEDCESYESCAGK